MFHKLTTPLCYLAHTDDEFFITEIDCDNIRGHFSHSPEKTYEKPISEINPHNICMNKWLFGVRSWKITEMDIIAAMHIEIMHEVKNGKFVPLARLEIVNNDCITHINYEEKIGLRYIEGGFLAESEEHMPLRLFGKEDWKKEGF